MLSFEQLPQRLEDARWFDRLGQVDVVADLQSAQAILRAREGGQGYGRRRAAGFRRQLPNPSQQFETVHAWHANVGDHHVGLVLRQRFQCAECVFGAVNTSPGAFRAWWPSDA